MEYTLDNINQWITELAEKPKIAQFRTYARVVRDKERQEAERTILDKFHPDNSHSYNRGAKDVTIINDHMAIIAFTSKKEKVTSYIPVVNGIISVYWFSTFEAAMLGAISILKTGNVDAVKYAAKLLEVDM